MDIVEKVKRQLGMGAKLELKNEIGVMDEFIILPFEVSKYLDLLSVTQQMSKIETMNLDDFKKHMTNLYNLIEEAIIISYPILKDDKVLCEKFILNNWANLLRTVMKANNLFNEELYEHLATRDK